MKTKFKLSNRILSLLLALVMVVGLLPMTAYAASNSATYNDGVYVLEVTNYKSYWDYNGAESSNLEVVGITDVTISVNANNQIVCSFKVQFYDGAGYLRTSSYSFSFTVENKSCTEEISHAFTATYDTADAFYREAKGTLIRAARTEHTGGQNTCVAGAVCSICNTAYGSVDSDAHNWGEWTYSEDGKHIRTCTLDSSHTESGNCSYSAATCLADSACSECGHIYEAKKDHRYTYTADGFVLTEKCENGCGHQAIASIVAGEALYTGSAITNAATISYDSGTWAGDKPVLSFENNVNVGTATAKMTAGGATASTTFKINPAKISGAAVTLNPTSGTYTGTAYNPSVSVTLDSFGTLVEGTDYTLSWNKTGFTNADTYTVTVTGEGNFEGTTERTFTINAANLADVKVEQVGTLTYTGEALTPAVSANAVAVNNQPITFTYSTESEGPYSTEIPSFTNVGWAHTVYYRATADNHNTYYGSFLVEIEKATVTEPTIASKPYTGSVQTADITDTELYTVVENNGGTGVKLNGYYDVVLKLKDSANYKWSTTDNAQVTLQFKITRAENEWAVTPSIDGWTYDKTANEPVGEAKFGEASVEYSGTTNGGAAYSSLVAPTEAGSYKATFTVQETEDYSGLNTSVDFTIAKADQAAPTGLTKTDTTYFGKADGKISGLTSAMEFRKEGDSSYTAGFNGTLGYLAAGTYYVRYQGDANHNPSPDAVVTVNAGRKLQIVVPQNQVGYTVTVNKTEMEYEGSYTLKVEIHEGYTATEDFKIIISNWECGQQAGVEKTYMNAIADQIIEVWGVADISPPASEIKVKENKWTSFWNNLTFGLFFKETQDVTITAADKGSGVKSIQYYLSNGELELDEVKAITDWVDYNGTFKIDPNNHYVVYAKVTDNTGNTLYINSDGIVLDNIAPTLEGIENDKTYYGDLTVIKSDEQFYDIKVVTLDGEPMGFAEGTYGLIPADNEEHIVVVEDHAGNKTTYTVTVMKNYTVTYKADGEPISTETVGHGKDANLPAVPAKNGYVGKWDSDGKNITGDTTITVVYTEIPVVKPNEVKPEDKTDLEDTKKQLEDMLKDDSYTDEDKKNIQDTIDDIDDALEVIGNVEAVEESISKLPAVDTVKPDDEEAIKAINDAQIAYDALSDYEKSLVDEATKANLDKLVAALVAYDIVEGDGSSWTEDSDQSITFVVNGLFSKFVGIKIDGKDVDKANYEVKAGSTIITLKASYLDTLAVGEHTITVVYTDGSTDGTFNVHAKADSPATGDNSHMFLWIALLFISGGAVITLTVVDRKRRSAANK